MPDKPSRPLPPEFQKQLDTARALGALGPFLTLLDRFGVGGGKLTSFRTELQSLVEQTEALTNTPMPAGSFATPVCQYKSLGMSSPNGKSGAGCGAAGRSQ